MELTDKEKVEILMEKFVDLDKVSEAVEQQHEDCCEYGACACECGEHPGDPGLGCAFCSLMEIVRKGQEVLGRNLVSRQWIINDLERNIRDVASDIRRMQAKGTVDADQVIRMVERLTYKLDSLRLPEDMRRRDQRYVSFPSGDAIPGKAEPFATHFQYKNWQEKNCEDCALFSRLQNFDDGFKCEIQEALELAAYQDGQVPDAIAKRMGFTEKTFAWDCPEKESQ